MIFLCRVKVLYWGITIYIFFLWGDCCQGAGGRPSAVVGEDTFLTLMPISSQINFLTQGKYLVKVVQLCNCIIVNILNCQTIYPSQDSFLVKRSQPWRKTFDRKVKILVQCNWQTVERFTCSVWLVKIQVERKPGQTNKKKHD